MLLDSVINISKELMKRIMQNFIPLSIPNFEGNERKYVDDALDQGWVSTGGAYIKKFEQNIAKFLHVENAAACQSGTSAIHLSLIEAGVTAGDVVLVPPVTFIAAVNPVKYQSAIPVFIDCDDSLCIDPAKFREFCENQCEFDGRILTWNKHRVKAIIVVHVFGNMADMEQIINTAQKFNIIVIEDATEALGTRYTYGEFAGKFAGTMGEFGAFSFNGNKIITTGGGGMVTALNPEAVEHMRFLSTQAKTDPHYYVHDEIGYNYRMTNLQAALGVAQLEELPEFIRRKNRNYELYKAEFEGFDLGFIMPFRTGTYSNKWFYSLNIDRSQVKASMREIITALHNEGIETRAIWGLINEQKPYKNNFTYKLEKAPHYASRILNLPSSTQITESEITFVADRVKNLLKRLANGQH